LSRALATRLHEGGARFITQRATGFDIVDGRVTRVMIDDGALNVDALVVAAGAQSAALAARLGNDVPLESERGYHVTVEAAGGTPKIPIASGEGKFFVTPMETGLRIAGTVELAGLDASPSWQRAEALLEKARRVLPGLRTDGFTRWMGHRPSLPDSLPVIGRSRHAKNAWFAFGHGHVGLTAAAPTGEIVADLVSGNPPFMGVAPFSAERF
jgi:D-amino-acid dehydrogenase